MMKNKRKKKRIKKKSIINMKKKCMHDIILLCIVSKLSPTNISCIKNIYVMNFQYVINCVCIKNSKCNISSD